METQLQELKTAAPNALALALPEEIERVIVTGDLKGLTPEQRVLYVNVVCKSVGLNPFTRPFDYIMLQNKLTLYARKDATDQLRKIHGISIVKLEREYRGDLLLVTAHAIDREGRLDQATGALSLKGLKIEDVAIAEMKAESKAKRRVTLSLAGLGFLDESEVEDIAEARPETRKAASLDDAVARFAQATGAAEPIVENVEPIVPEDPGAEHDRLVDAMAARLQELDPPGTDAELTAAVNALAHREDAEWFSDWDDKMLAFVAGPGWSRARSQIGRDRERAVAAMSAEVAG